VSILQRHLGVPELPCINRSQSQIHYAGKPENVIELQDYILQRASARELMDVIDCVLLAFRIGDLQDYNGHSADDFAVNVKYHLCEHGLPYDIANGRTMPKDSEILHREVGMPALTSLNSDPRFSDALAAYSKAYEELRRRSFATAVTDSCAAVELTLKALLPPAHAHRPFDRLVQEARAAGIFPEGWPGAFTASLSALGSLRNNEGNAHGAFTDEHSAWFATMWAGAIIKYLIDRANVPDGQEV
jgi:hypothetical protein